MEKLDLLKDNLAEKRMVAVAFSGGVDSTFLLKVAHDVLGDGAIAVTVRNELCSEEEMCEAEMFCRNNGIKQIIVSPDILHDEAFAVNPPDRCYICKKKIFSSVIEEAKGYTVMDGTNADDTGDYRPGMRALSELGILSPLKELGFTKKEIRDLSVKMGLPTADKPSAACLASRIAYGERITEDKLKMADKAECCLRRHGIVNCRVRIHGDIARIETSKKDMELVLKVREEVTEIIKSYGIRYVTLDLEGYRTGSMNEVL